MAEPGLAVAPTPAALVRVLPWHVLAVVLVQSTQNAVVFMLPVIAKKNFAASDWQVLLITAPPTVLFVFSIFWSDAFRRLAFGRYMLVNWAVTSIPPAFIALTGHGPGGYWPMVAMFMLACCGFAGYFPASGELLKRLYPDRARGRMYSVVSAANLVAGAGLVYAAGAWLEHDPEAFRTALPIASICQLGGCALFVSLARAHPREREPAPETWTDQSWATRVFGPITHMREALAADPIFARYEAAYMTYGVGWMIGYALLPLLATNKLHLSYKQFPASTQTPYLLAMVVAIAPAGWLLDRIGAVRSVGISFGALALYPLLLITADDPRSLALASVVYGIAHAGASVGWMLGPVSLAPTPQKVPLYVAIHATLVGLRGAVFQFAGVAFYRATGSFVWPLLVAALAYLWSSYQMIALHRRRTSAG